MLSIAYIALSWPSRSLRINCMCSLFFCCCRWACLTLLSTNETNTHKMPFTFTDTGCAIQENMPLHWHFRASTQIQREPFFSVQIAYESEWDVTFAHEKRPHLKLFALRPLIMAMQINLDGIQTANNVKRHINGTPTTKKRGHRLRIGISFEW